jgi:hypothetical protein
MMAAAAVGYYVPDSPDIAYLGFSIAGISMTIFVLALIVMVSMNVVAGTNEVLLHIIWKSFDGLDALLSVFFTALSFAAFYRYMGDPKAVQAMELIMLAALCAKYLRNTDE